MSNTADGSKLTGTELPQGTEPNPQDGSTDNEGGQSGAEDLAPNSEIIRKFQAEAHRDGRKKAQQELLGKLGVGSAEELSEIVESFKSSRRQAEDKKMVDKEEKEALVNRIRELQGQVQELQPKAQDYESLATTTMRQMVKEEAAKHGVRDDAVEDLVTMAMQSVQWSGGQVEVLESNEDGSVTPTGTMESLIKGLKERKSYLFRPEVESTPQVQGSFNKPSGSAPKKHSDLSAILGIPVPR